MRAFAPTGAPIIKSLQRLAGTCQLVEDAFERDASSGEITVDYADGTEPNWDSGEHVAFLDAAGHEWTDDHLILHDAERIVVVGGGDAGQMVLTADEAEDIAAIIEGFTPFEGENMQIGWKRVRDLLRILRGKPGAAS